MAASVRFPGEDGGRSLAEMAQSDLDAALQLLVDRAQYITGASGAAIALRRDGRDDMLCRASSGTNAPELGALLSTEFGLSGESVRTRQLLRCDDAERDARVNREVCQQMGIASVLVMPVVNDDQVLGVFELFSGKANAFGERDLSAVQRLSEMVETAVRLAHATETLPEQLSERESSVAEAVHPEVFEGQFLSDLVVEDVRQHPEEQAPETMAAAALESPVAAAIPPLSDAIPQVILPEPQAASPQLQDAAAASPDPIGPSLISPGPLSPGPVSPDPVAKKSLFWSAAAAGDSEAVNTGDADQSHVPPVLRGLRKCEACGFPISAGRVLCVECEEKKWRGQLRPQAPGRKRPAGVTAVSASNSTGGAFAAAAASMAKTAEVPSQRAAGVLSKAAMVSPMPGPFPVEEIAAPVPAGEITSPAEAPQLVLSAGLESSTSWLSSNKYIVLALLVIGAAAAAFLLLR
jgi:GAF domain-containing protein